VQRISLSPRCEERVRVRGATIVLTVAVTLFAACAALIVLPLRAAPDTRDGGVEVR